ncbi:MAG TPA: helix-turn-helix domain-containing protein [Candidatus Omnitrophota bacterium]|jgi:hypothetical protein|nr:helix-turn-helix domain-containing protein [Candidatus Omnitrophota bacterium]
MGVVYKLTQSVIDFILAEKAASPTLSCRKLAELVYKNFSIRLSKSSISAVLKEAHLNSPVGRRTLPGSSCPPQLTRKKPKKVLINKIAFQPYPQEVFDVKAGISDLSSLPDETKKAFQVVPDIGYMFIKAAEWELFRESFLAEIFSERFSFFDKIQINSLVEKLLYMEIFEKNDASEGLWKEGLSQNDKRIFNVEGLWSELSGMDNWAETVMKFVVNLQYYMTKVSFVQLKLENGKNLFLDAEVSSVWTNDSDLPFFNTVNQSTKAISDEIINNVQPVTFCFCPILNIKENLSQKVYCAQQFLDLCATFDNKEGKRILQISMLDSEMNEIACFGSIPPKKRYFITCLWPWQPEFHPLLRAIRANRLEKFMDPFFETCVYFFETFTTLPVDDDFQPRLGLRVFPLKENRMSSPFGIILTNAPNDLYPASKILERYCRRWPNFQRGFNYSVGKIKAKDSQFLLFQGNNFNINKNINIKKIFADFLAHYAWHTYFSSGKKSLIPVHLKDIILPLSGTITVHPESRQILLMPSSDYACLEELNSAVTRINERNIVDFYGKRLMMKIVSRRQ